jgi:peroxidase
MMKPTHGSLESRIAALDNLLNLKLGLQGIFGHDFDGYHPPTDGSFQPATNASLQFRSIDGSGNNLADPSLGAAGHTYTRIDASDPSSAHFLNNDGITPLSETNADLPNARVVSNIVSDTNGADSKDAGGLSGMMYAWGQFIDHDIERADTGTTPIPINFPADDPTAPGATIPLTRDTIAPGTGTPDNPALPINDVTTWMDGSQIYGSDKATADSLRTFEGGHLATSAGNNLPIDPNTGQFMAGDVRAAETPDLTALQTLFVREHNYQADLLHKEHPTWTDEQLYQNAKAIVIAEEQNITYSEFLPHLLGPNAIPTYHGYDPSVDPSITNEFAAAAYRFGHSIVSSDINQIDNQGTTTAAQELADVFFEPGAQYVASANGGTPMASDAMASVIPASMTSADMTMASATGNDTTSGLLRHLVSDIAQANDTQIIDDLRNELAGGGTNDILDLGAIDIQRERDLGLGTLNQTREELGLRPYTSFDQITSDPATQAKLEQAFGNDVNKVDLFIGGLAEDHQPGAMVGPTFDTIIAQQFTDLRDGDRLWFQNQGFDPQTLSTIEHTTLSDIIERNTDTNVIQQDAFVGTDRHTGTAGVNPNPEDSNLPQLVIGTQGVADTLTGGPQGDTLAAATGGLQTMTGLGGADKFVVPKGGNVVITDFQPGLDSVSVAGNSDLGSLPLRTDGQGNTIINSGDTHVVLQGVSPDQLQNLLVADRGRHKPFVPTDHPSNEMQHHFHHLDLAGMHHYWADWG